MSQLIGKKIIEVRCMTELGADKTHFNTNDGNFDISGQNWKLIGREKTLMEFGDT